MVQRIKLSIAYLGTPFHGWQRQSGQKTVQGELESAARSFVDNPSIVVVGAGRTDAGVHAAAQSAHIDLPHRIPLEALVRGLNVRLPEEIRIRSAGHVPQSFHARRSARGKLYVYRVRWRLPTLPWIGQRTAVYPRPEDRDSLFDAVARFPGRRDWASFTVTNPGSPSTIRSLFRLTARERRDGIDFEFVGEGFLRYQIRRMVGAILEVGLRQRNLESFDRLLHTPQPGAPVRTAASRGLTLERVYFRNTPVFGVDSRQ